MSSDPGRQPAREPADQPAPDPESRQAGEPDMQLYDLRVTVDSIEGRSVCGLSPGDYIDLTDSSQLRLPPGGHFCLYALAAVLPLLPAKQRHLPESDWLERDSLVACPDPEERLIMRITRTRLRSLRSSDLS